MPDSADPVAAALAQDKQDVAANVAVIVVDAAGMPKVSFAAGMLAGIADRRAEAVEAALKLADRWEAEAAGLDKRAESRAADGNHRAAGLLNGRSQAYEELAGDLRSAISRALLGEEPQ